jgi:DNA-binding protein HU-beta
MNKTALIESIATDTKLSKNACKSMLESFIKQVEKSLKKNNPVVLTGFGTFGVIKRKARTGVNPSTGAPMNIPARKVPKFKPGKRLKDLVS